MRAAIDSMLSSLFPSVAHAFQLGLVIWLAMLGFKIARGVGDPLREMGSSLIYAAAVSATVTLATYQSWVRDVALDLPNVITSAMGGSSTFGPNVFDELWGRAWAGGLRVWQAASWSDFGIQVLVVVFWIVAAVASAAGFAIWLCARVILYLMIAIGPLFFVLYLFSATRTFCQRWIGAVIGCITLQVLVAALLTILLHAEQTLLTSLSHPAGAGPFAGMRMLIAAGLLFVVCALILRELPGAATALAGGVHWHAGQLTHAQP